jgi:hypothetical protein
MALLRTRTSLPTRPLQEQSKKTQIDRRIRAVPRSSALRQVEPASVFVRKAVFADRNPTENYDKRATQQSCQEHDFEHAHREYDQSKGHDWTLLFGPESLEACRSQSISTIQLQSSHGTPQAADCRESRTLRRRTDSSDAEVVARAWSEYADGRLE